MPIELREVSHHYAGPPILAGVNLRLDAGDTLAVMGPSGSGKTTLLSILGLLLAPTSGQVIIDDEPVPSRSGHRERIRTRRFAWVFQTVNVLASRSGLDNVVLGLIAHGSTREDAEPMAREALAGVGLADKWQQRTHELSGGELQRVCVARAIAAKPGYLLADEPTGQLDKASTLRVIEALLVSRPPGTAVVIATHDPMVAQHCDRVVALIDGHLSEP